MYNLWPSKKVKITENHQKVTENGPKWSKIKILKFCLTKSFIIPRYILYSNFIIVDYILKAGKFIKWFFQFFTISIFVLKFILNYEGFGNFNVPPFENERVFLNSVKSYELRFRIAIIYQKWKKASDPPPSYNPILSFGSEYWPGPI